MAEATVRRRVRQVYPTDRLVLRWLQGYSEGKRNPKGNLLCEGQKLFSYGHHHLLARKVWHGERKCVLINACWVSKTTARQSKLVQQKCQNCCIAFFKVSNPDGLPEEERTYFEGRIRNAQEKLQRARSRLTQRYCDLMAEIGEANNFFEFFLGANNSCRFEVEEWVNIAELQKRVEKWEQRQWNRSLKLWRQGDPGARVWSWPSLYLRLRDHPDTPHAQIDMSASGRHCLVREFESIVSLLSIPGGLYRKASGQGIRLGNEIIQEITEKGTIHFADGGQIDGQEVVAMLQQIQKMRTGKANLPVPGTRRRRFAFPLEGVV